MFLLEIALIGLASGPWLAFDKTDPTVGAEGSIEQIVLPGTELIGKPITADSPIIVRMKNAFPHGDSFRYDIQFYGLEPGSFDLREFLQRKDGTPTAGLPEIPVQIRTLLPPGQVEPNPLQAGWLLPRLGGYRVVAVTAAMLWFSGLLFLILYKRPKISTAVIAKKEITLAELLQPRLTEALESRMTPSQYAELERMLFALWRKRLALEAEKPEVALAKIHSHQEAGPLMKQLESWMHNPARDSNVDLAHLLKPYRQIPAEATGKSG